MKNEKTSARVAKLAGKFLAMKTRDYIRWYSSASYTEIRDTIMSLAASALTQAPDIKRYDDFGFDPRDGGKVGKQHVPNAKTKAAIREARVMALAPKRGRRGVAHKGQGKKRSSSPFYPSAKPPRNSP